MTQMLRIVLGLCLAIPFFAIGCANFIETQAITRFAAAIEEQDLAELKSRATDEFEKKALRSTEALKDFEILNLPEGKAEIVKVEDVSKDEKRVIVEVGEKKRRLQYKLVRDEKTRKWLVDDITVKQKKSDLTAAKSVSEQMDLLLTVREFLEACKSHDRDTILAVATPELQSLIEGLPPASLQKLTDRVVDEKAGKGKSRPNAQMEENAAIVQIPRTGGNVLLTFKLVEGAWRVADVGVEARKSENALPSLQKTATVMKVAFNFLDSYAASDRQTLARVCTPKLYKSSLEHADLATIPLPTSNVAADKHEIMLDGVGADFVINGEKEVVRIALDRRDSQEPGQATEFIVKEVTIYPLDSRQNKRLSAAFNAHSLVQVFCQALARRELPLLRRTSTVNFGDRVWKQLDDVTVLDMPLAAFEGSPPKIVDTLFQGALTEVTVEHSMHTMTYVLRERSGELKVDDVICAIPDRPPSLKETLEGVLPAVRFLHAIRISDLRAIQRVSSVELNRLTWTQLDSLPPLCNVVVNHLQRPLSSIQNTGDTTLVVFGDDDAGARVTLTKEHDRLVVDEIQIVAGRQPQERPFLKQTIRNEIAEGRIQARRAVEVKPGLQQVNVQQNMIRPTADTIQPADDAFAPPEEPATAPTTTEAVAAPAAANAAAPASPVAPAAAN
jgi:hypothetical protein